MEEINLDFLSSPPRYGQQLERRLTPIVTNRLDIKFGRKKSHKKNAELAQKLANVDELVKQVETSKQENIELQKQLKDFQKSAQQVQQLYNEEKQQHERIKKDLQQLKEQYTKIDVDLANKTMKYDQMQARLSEYEGRPVSYDNLVIKFVRIMKKFEGEDFLRYCPDKGLVDNLVQYCKEMNLKLPSVRSPQKSKPRRGKPKMVDVSVQCSHKEEQYPIICKPEKIEQCTQTKIETEKCLVKPNLTEPCPAKPNLKEQYTQCQVVKRDQASQYISTMITRQTNTDKVLQKHVSTMFPEEKPTPPINDILNVFCKWGNIRSVTPLEESPSRKSPKKSVRFLNSVGTCTMLCNIRRRIDYLPPTSMGGGIKQEMITPSASPTPTSNANLGCASNASSSDNNNSQPTSVAPNQNHLPNAISSLFNATSNSALGQLSATAFNELWQIFGTMLFSLLQTNNAGIANINHNSINQQQFLDWLLELYVSSSNNLRPTATVSQQVNSTQTSPIRFNNSSILASTNILKPQAKKSMNEELNASRENDINEQSNTSEENRNSQQNTIESTTPSYTTATSIENFSNDSNSMDSEIQQIQAAANTIEIQTNIGESNINQLSTCEGTTIKSRKHKNKHKIPDQVQETLPKIKKHKNKHKSLKRLSKESKHEKKSKKNRSDKILIHRESDEGEQQIETAVDFIKIFAQEQGIFESNKFIFEKSEAASDGLAEGLSYEESLVNTENIQQDAKLLVNSSYNDFTFIKPKNIPTSSTKFSKDYSNTFIKPAQKIKKSKSKIIENKLQMLFGDSDSEIDEQENDDRQQYTKPVINTIEIIVNDDKINDRNPENFSCTQDIINDQCDNLDTTYFTDSAYQTGQQMSNYISMDKTNQEEFSSRHSKLFSCTQDVIKEQCDDMYPTNLGDTNYQTDNTNQEAFSNSNSEHFSSSQNVIKEQSDDMDLSNLSDTNYQIGQQNSNCICTDNTNQEVCSNRNSENVSCTQDIKEHGDDMDLTNLGDTADHQTDQQISEYISMDNTNQEAFSIPEISTPLLENLQRTTLFKNQSNISQFPNANDLLIDHNQQKSSKGINSVFKRQKQMQPASNVTVDLENNSLFKTPAYISKYSKANKSGEHSHHVEMKSRSKEINALSPNNKFSLDKDLELSSDDEVNHMENKLLSSKYFVANEVEEGQYFSNNVCALPNLQDDYNPELKSTTIKTSSTNCNYLHLSSGIKSPKNAENFGTKVQIDHKENFRENAEVTCHNLKQTDANDTKQNPETDEKQSLESCYAVSETYPSDFEKDFDLSSDNESDLTEMDNQLNNECYADPITTCAVDGMVKSSDKNLEEQQNHALSQVKVIQNIRNTSVNSSDKCVEESKQNINQCDAVMNNNEALIVKDLKNSLTDSLTKSDGNYNPAGSHLNEIGAIISSPQKSQNTKELSEEYGEPARREEINELQTKPLIESKKNCIASTDRIQSNDLDFKGFDENHYKFHQKYKLPNICISELDETINSDQNQSQLHNVSNNKEIIIASTGRSQNNEQDFKGFEENRYKIDQKYKLPNICMSEIDKTIKSDQNQSQLHNILNKGSSKREHNISLSREPLPDFNKTFIPKLNLLNSETIPKPIQEQNVYNAPQSKIHKNSLNDDSTESKTNLCWSIITVSDETKVDEDISVANSPNMSKTSMPKINLLNSETITKAIIKQNVHNTSQSETHTNDNSIESQSNLCWSSKTAPDKKESRTSFISTSEEDEEIYAAEKSNMSKTSIPKINILNSETIPKKITKQNDHNLCQSKLHKNDSNDDSTESKTNLCWSTVTVSDETESRTRFISSSEEDEEISATETTNLRKTSIPNSETITKAITDRNASTESKTNLCSSTKTVPDKTVNRTRFVPTSGKDEEISVVKKPNLNTLSIPKINILNSETITYSVTEQNFLNLSHSNLHKNYSNDNSTEIKTNLCWSTITVPDKTKSRTRFISTSEEDEEMSTVEISSDVTNVLDSKRDLESPIENDLIIDEDDSSDIPNNEDMEIPNQAHNLPKKSINECSEDCVEEEHNYYQTKPKELKTENLSDTNNDTLNTSNISSILNSSLYNELLTDSMKPIVNDLLKDDDDILIIPPQELKAKRGRKRKSECLPMELIQPCKRSQRLKAKQIVLEESLNVSETPIEIGKYTRIRKHSIRDLKSTYGEEIKKKNININQIKIKDDFKADNDLEKSTKNDLKQNFLALQMGFFKERTEEDSSHKKTATNINNIERLSGNNLNLNDNEDLQIKSNSKTIQMGLFREQRDITKEILPSINENYSDFDFLTCKKTKVDIKYADIIMDATEEEVSVAISEKTSPNLEPLNQAFCMYSDSPKSPLAPANENDDNFSKTFTIIPAERSPQHIPQQRNGDGTLFDNLLNSYSSKHFAEIQPPAAKSFKFQHQILEKLEHELHVYCYDEMELDSDYLAFKLTQQLLQISGNLKFIQKALVNIAQHAKADQIPDDELPSIIQEMPPRHLARCLQRLYFVLKHFLTKDSNFCQDLILHIERLLFDSQQAQNLSLEATLNLTQLYLLACKHQESLVNSKHPARLFIAKCLYYYRLKSKIMIFEVLHWYPTVLPHREDNTYDRSDALITVIQELLMNTKYDMNNSDTRDKLLLSKLRYEYHYEPFQPTLDEVIFNLVEKIKKSKFENISMAFGVLCKRLEPKKVQELFLQGQLLPLASEYYNKALNTLDYDLRISALLEIISMIVKPFPVDTNVEVYLNEFSRFLNGFDRPLIQEAALCSILHLQRFGFVNCYNLLCHFKPTFELKPYTQAKLKTFIYRKPLKFWKQIKSQNPKY